jgi:hypothetical protein
VQEESEALAGLLRCRAGRHKRPGTPPLQPHGQPWACASHRCAAIDWSGCWNMPKKKPKNPAKVAAANTKLAAAQQSTKEFEELMGEVSS